MGKKGTCVKVVKQKFQRNEPRPKLVAEREGSEDRIGVALWVITEALEEGSAIFYTRGAGPCEGETMTLAWGKARILTEKARTRIQGECYRRERKISKCANSHPTVSGGNVRDKTEKNACCLSSPSYTRDEHTPMVVRKNRAPGVWG